MQITDDLPKLLAVLPTPITEALNDTHRDTLTEIVLDLGRPAVIRFTDGHRTLDGIVTREDIAGVVKKLSDFADDNRAGIEGTLHRISAIRNRKGEIIGLTCRVGRAVTGTIAHIRDVIESGKSILLLGKPGVGKSTKLREATRVLADDCDKRVVVVDTSNEIAGDGDVPHPAVGSARRLQVAHVALQHEVMLEGVTNHMPEVVVVDEIGNDLEARAARTISERGVQLIATAHGNVLEDLLRNPDLNDLLGGIQAVTLSDKTANARGTQKTVLERKAPPTFGVLVELVDRQTLAIIHDLEAAVDATLRKEPVTREVRTLTEKGVVSQLVQSDTEQPAKKAEALKLFVQDLDKDRVQQALLRMPGRPVTLVRHIESATHLLTTKRAVSRHEFDDFLHGGGEIIVVRTTSYAGIVAALERTFGVDEPKKRLQTDRQSGYGRFRG